MDRDALIFFFAGVVAIFVVNFLSEKVATTVMLALVTYMFWTVPSRFK